MRRWRLPIPYHNGAAPRCRGEKQLREIVRKPNAAVARGITGQLTGVHGDAGLSEPLHVGHGRVVILFRAMGFLLLQNSEHTARRASTLTATDS